MASQKSLAFLDGIWARLPGGMGSLLRQRPFWAVVVALGLIVGGRIAWKRHEQELVSQPQFLLQPDNLYVTPQPPWIKSNVANTAYRTGDMQGKSLLDRTLVEQVHTAFSVQTWVDDVLEVRKSPTGVRVQLSYRRPVGMVEIQYEGEPRFQPVDAQGVLLPGNEFSQKETWNYVKISVLEPTSQGLIHGTPWPDKRIQAAAKVAAKIESIAADLGVYRIQEIPSDEPQDATIFELHLVNQDRFICKRILWGRAPGEETPGEATADVKLERLIAAEAGSEDWLPRGESFDLSGFAVDLRSGQLDASL